MQLDKKKAKTLVFIIIVTYNGEKWIEKCLNSVNSNYRIIVIDNNSTDSTKEIIKRKFQYVQLLELDENIGFGKANNIGIKGALDKAADYVFLLNQDAWVEPSTIELLIKCQIEHHEYGIVSPMHLSGAGDELDKNFASYMNSSITPGLLSDLYRNRIKSIYTTSYVNAAAWLISKECLEMVGGFDPVFPHYGEDDDYLKRVSYFGLKVGIVPEAKIFHDRIYKSPSNLKLDLNRRFIIDVLKVKNIQTSFIGNFIYYSKYKFDEISSKLMYRQFLEVKIIFQAYIKLIWLLPKLYKSYKISKNQSKAFIQ